MSAANNGGPAFPIPGDQHDEDFNGMSLRDYFAARAMHAALQGATMPKESWPEMLPIVANFAYAQADAMLEARK